MSDYLTQLRALRARYDSTRRDHREAVRTLDRATATLERIPEHARDRVAAALCVRYPALGAILSPPVVEPLCPAYPRVREAWAARLVLGERPTQLARGLTRREAHEALRDGASSDTDALDWLLADTPVEGREVRSVAVARWILACWRDPARRAALETERVERGPGGEEIRGRLIARVDEISARDLARGEATGVREAFESCARRAFARWEAEHERRHEPLAAAPRWWRPIRCARLLMSGAELVAEGREMRHCVGTYAAHVRSGRSVIVSLCVRDRDGAVHRSTAELDRATASVRQHKASANGPPHWLCERALRVIERRAKGGL